MPEPREADGLRRSTDDQWRCWWCGDDPDYVAYHDTEWGRPVRDDTAVFERLCLEGFQAGLSWLTILRKRAAFRRAFAGFDPAAVADFSDAEVDRLLADDGIVRHRGKILAAIGNARIVCALQAEGRSLGSLVWAHAPNPPPPAPQQRGEIPTVTPEASMLSATLRRLGWRFIGPTSAYAAMQAMGLVNDHLAGCSARLSRG